MAKLKKKTHKPPEYMLCFHDFSKENKHADIFVRLQASCEDRKKAIFKLFNQKSNSTRFIRQLYGIDSGHWRLIHIEKTGNIPLVNYTDADIDKSIKEGG